MVLATADECQDPEIHAHLARIYNDRCYTKDGVVNPFDPRYGGGGGHFSRRPEWFEQNLGEGSRLILVCDRDGRSSLVGYGLFYVDSGKFPGFASDALWPKQIESIGAAFAYTYLFIIEERYTRLGLGWQLMSAIRDECRRAGCRAIIHEFFVRPVVNVASACIHRKMGREWGAVDTGRTASHTVERPNGNVSIYYAQHLIPTKDGERLTIDARGEISFAA
ncbi:MAG: hypothetical protein DCC75_06650 [Proteobacteria bacterium]|nr:MAG: hypothetical protein DCC75_06650 [Pseudomonadota bacterium]